MISEKDLRERLAVKVKTLQELRAQLQQIDAQREQILQHGLELQGAIKELNEVINPPKPIPVVAPTNNSKPKAETSKK